MTDNKLVTNYMFYYNFIEQTLLTLCSLPLITHFELVYCS